VLMMPVVSPARVKVRTMRRINTSSRHSSSSLVGARAPWKRG
jgi:hypothetical protein